MPAFLTITVGPPLFGCVGEVVCRDSRRFTHSLVVVLLFSKHLSFTMSARAAGATNLTQGSENFGYSAVRLRRIVKLQFGIVNPQEMVSFWCV